MAERNKHATAAPAYTVRKNIQLAPNAYQQILALSLQHNVPEAEIMRRAIDLGLSGVPDTFSRSA